MATTASRVARSHARAIGVALGASSSLPMGPVGVRDGEHVRVHTQRCRTRGVARPTLPGRRPPRRTGRAPANPQQLAHRARRRDSLVRCGARRRWAPAAKASTPWPGWPRATRAPMRTCMWGEGIQQALAVTVRGREPRHFPRKSSARTPWRFIRRWKLSRSIPARSAAAVTLPCTSRSSPMRYSRVALSRSTAIASR